jgi:hypothetical protein
VSEDSVPQFSGKLKIDNWALTRRQSKINQISFETDSYDIYNPQFSSQESQLLLNLDSSKDESEEFCSLN